MFTLEKRYGITGYGFWFKLLEVLGNTEGHFIDAQDPATLEFLSAYTYTDKETCLEILNLLATLDAIDPELWQDKLIWSDNFITGLLPLYRKRDCNVPTKPDKRHHKPPTLGKKKRKTAEVVEVVEVVEEGEKDIGDSEKNSSSPVAPKILYSCKHFELDEEFIKKLRDEYPALSGQRLKKEVSAAHDWLDDNPKSPHKRRANGRLKNPRSFLKKWLENIVIEPGGHLGGVPEPKSFAAMRANKAMRRGENVDG